MKYIIFMVVVATLDIFITQIGLLTGLAIEANPVMALVIHLLPFNLLKIYLTYLVAKSVFSKEKVIYDNLDGMGKYGTMPEPHMYYIKGAKMALRGKLITGFMMITIIIWNVLVIAVSAWFLKYEIDMMVGAYIIYYGIVCFLLLILGLNIFNIWFRHTYLKRRV